jgi:hypothetical protein
VTRHRQGADFSASIGFIEGFWTDTAAKLWQQRSQAFRAAHVGSGQYGLSQSARRGGDPLVKLRAYPTADGNSAAMNSGAICLDRAKLQHISLCWLLRHMRHQELWRAVGTHYGSTWIYGPTAMPSEGRHSRHSGSFYRSYRSWASALPVTTTGQK